MFSSNTSQVSNDANYIEECFSTYLYTGTQSTQTITNGIDLAGKGGLVWIKDRTTAWTNVLTDTARGAGKSLFSNSSEMEVTNDSNGHLSAFNSNGFTLAGGLRVNASNDAIASWTFRKQPKFFDVVTWTGTGTFPRTITHSLGSQPGCIIAKATSTTGDWYVSHRATANPYIDNLYLNTTAAASAVGTFDNVTSTSFETYMNANGVTYVAYLFAHDAGGFGLTGTDNVISCGSYTGNGSDNGPTITLGYEPQWLLIKRSSSADNWVLVDTMRGFFNNGTEDDYYLNPNLSSAETAFRVGEPTATGFKLRSLGSNVNANGSTYIYIAIRRGPMKVPASGTSVFAPQAWTGDGSASRSFSGGFVDDAFLFRNRAVVTEDFWFDRLRGNSNFLQTANTNAEVPYPFPFVLFDSQQNGVVSGTSPGFGGINTTGVTSVGYHFKRAPSFFDEVCWTTTQNSGAVKSAIPHNLGVVPEFYFFKQRGGSNPWFAYTPVGGQSQYLTINSSNAFTTFGSLFGSAGQISATTFGVDEWNTIGPAGQTAVCYLFATCPGVSKVGSYTGTGTTLQVNCGFTGGARFVLIKRTDSTGDWYVWDSARGIVSGNDPYLLLNSTAAEVTNTDYVDTYSAGFEISSTAPAAINASGGTFIFLAIA